MAEPGRTLRAIDTPSEDRPHAPIQHHRSPCVMTEPDVSHRSSDDSQQTPAAERSFITFDRRLPLPWAMGIVGAFALFLGTMYFQQKQTDQKVGDMANDVRQIRTDVQAQGVKDLENSFTLRDLGRRMSAAEVDLKNLQAAQQQQTKASR